MTTSQKFYLVSQIYEINSNGDIFNIATQNVISLSDNQRGYLKFTANCGPKVRFTICAHCFQAYQMFGDKIFGSDIHVRHLDGNRYNNSAANIEIGTAQENMLDKSEEVRRMASLIAASKKRRFSDVQHEEIRKFYDKCGSLSLTKHAFGAHYSTLRKILREEYQTSVV